MLENFIRNEHRVWDTGTWDEVVNHDCYNIRNRKWNASDVIIDVGANIGLFSGFALEHGAGLVIAIEPSPANFKRLSSNLYHYASRVIVMQRAVWRSDIPDCRLRLSDNVPDGNTGGINVLANRGEVEVKTISLDELIGSRTISFLKVDCEGSEYPILYTSQRLPQVREIIIEVHPVDHLLQENGNVRPGSNNPEGLTEYLGSLGFKASWTRRNELPEGWAYLHAVQ